ncbi:MAG: AraC family transcriptional regulator [Desulfobacteraceae bacterium]|nr:AraC family transcriptional regulator [Desulfobacteraceae bacterium]
MNDKCFKLSTDENELGKAHEKLASKIAGWTRESGRFETRIPGLVFRRCEYETEPQSYMHEPGICLVAQGAKKVLLENETYVYDAFHFLITSIDLPVIANVIEASPEKPYLGLMMKLDLKEISQLILEYDISISREKPGRGIAVSRVSTALVNSFLRLTDLLDEPENIPALAPLAQREILYRLLISEQGPRLRQITASGTHSEQISRAIGWLKENYSKSFKVDELSSRVGMSTSTFHHHFRAITAMSPLQFQKCLRLHEARQLMLNERVDAANAAFSVGYESPSQFSREYSRFFGSPPLRDIKRLSGVYQ